MDDFAFVESSDEEALLPPPSSSKKSAKKSAKAASKASKNPAASHPAASDSGSDSDAPMELDGDFTGSSQLLSSASLGALNDLAPTSWNFASAIALLTKNDKTGVERTEVGDLVRAKRGDLVRKRGGEEEGEGEEDEVEEGEESGSEADGSGGSSSDGSGSSGESSDGSSDSSDSEADDDHEGLDHDDLKQTTKDEAEAVEHDGKEKKKTRKTKEKEKASDEGKTKAKTKGKTKAKSEGSDSGSDDDDSDDDDSDDSDSDSDASSSSASSAAEAEVVDAQELEKETNFYGETVEATTSSQTLFSQLSLSRPLMRGVSSMGYVTPTPIQVACVPPALASRDICASAVTGSGKTAAFLLPTLERLLHYPRAPAASRALVLTPTRELAAQCLSMLLSLARFTDIRATLVVGGAKNMPAQATELRTRPDVIIATPGRILDHVTNSASFDLDDVQVLILDEADRLLELGFAEEVLEIVKACPASRQTLLFSATFGTKVDDLVGMSLKKPVRIKVGMDRSRNEVEIAPRLEQEFVRIRTGNEANREAVLLSLLSRTFRDRTIVFFDTKVAAHRLMILAGLCGIKGGELHGNLTQTQRLAALEAFKDGGLKVLFCTDLAARGLDVSNVAAVVNFEMPSRTSTYVHRVGRTARAGCGGKACTLISEGRRHLMKEVVRDAEKKNGEGGKGGVRAVIRSRTVPQSVISHFNKKIESLEEHIKEILSAEYVARLDRQTQIEAERAVNVIEHADEIKARPRKEWFVGQKERDAIQEARIKEITEAGTGSHRLTRKKKRRMEMKQEQEKWQEVRRKEREESGDTNQPKKADRMNEETVKASARAKKMQETGKRDKDPANMSLHDENQERLKNNKMHNKKLKTKANRGIDSSGLFQDEKVQFSKPKEARGDEGGGVKAQKRKSRDGEGEGEGKDPEGWRGYDPVKAEAIRRGAGKKGASTFKSKSRHKRR